MRRFNSFHSLLLFALLWPTGGCVPFVRVNTSRCDDLVAVTLERRVDPIIRTRQDLERRGEILVRGVIGYLVSPSRCNLVVYGKTGSIVDSCRKEFKRGCAATFLYDGESETEQILVKGRYFLLDSTDKLETPEHDDIWSPDGSKVVLDYYGDLYLATVGIEGATFVNEHIKKRGAHRIRLVDWSPDSRFLALSLVQRLLHSTKQRLVRFDAATGEWQYVSTIDCPKSDPLSSCWSPDDLLWRPELDFELRVSAQAIREKKVRFDDPPGQGTRPRMFEPGGDVMDPREPDYSRIGCFFPVVPVLAAVDPRGVENPGLLESP